MFVYFSRRNIVEIFYLLDIDILISDFYCIYPHIIYLSIFRRIERRTFHKLYLKG